MPRARVPPLKPEHPRTPGKCRTPCCCGLATCRLWCAPDGGRTTRPSSGTTWWVGGNQGRPLAPRAQSSACLVARHVQRTDVSVVMGRRCAERAPHASRRPCSATPATSTRCTTWAWCWRCGARRGRPSRAWTRRRRCGRAIGASWRRGRACCRWAVAHGTGGGWLRGGTGGGLGALRIQQEIPYLGDSYALPQGGGECLRYGTRM